MDAKGMRVTFSCRLDGLTTFAQFYSNLFTYRLYMGVCLLLMLIYSVMYLLLAEFVERINPGEFGVPQPWNYLLRKSYWQARSKSVVRPTQTSGQELNPWIELHTMDGKHRPAVSVSHLSKVSCCSHGEFKTSDDRV